MPTRKIIQIDEEKCNGCGECVTGCEEGALAVIDGKAKLVSDVFCDGLGACIGECPTGALTIEERPAAEFDEKAVEEHLKKQAPAAGERPEPMCGCPGTQARNLKPGPKAAPSDGAAVPSQLANWPIQLKLIQPSNPQFAGADLLIAADCTAFAAGGFQNDLLSGRSLIIACPKLDDPAGYIEKLSALFGEAKPASVTVARMEVPCCTGLTHMVLEARKAAGADTAVEEVVIGVQGEKVSSQTV